MLKQKFHISDILSVTSSRSLSTRGLQGLEDILEFMTGKAIYAGLLKHMLDSKKIISFSEALNECSPMLLKKYPKLKFSKEDISEIINIQKRFSHNKKMFKKTTEIWAKNQEKKHGKMLEVETIY